MMSAFFRQFPLLWEVFEEQLKQQYLEQISQSIETGLPLHRHIISDIYQKTGWNYWNLARGKGFPWIREFEEVFFEQQYVPVKQMLYHDKGLGVPVAESILRFFEKTAGVSEAKDPLKKQTMVSDCYLFAVKPHLDARKQEISRKLHEMEEELQQPVSYEMELPVDGIMQNLQLFFQSMRRKYAMWESLEGYTYSFHGRSYCDISSLWQEALEELTKDVFIGKDVYGEKVLKTYQRIPTFDCSDREWDSRVLKFLIFDGKEIQLVVMRGGYHIANLTFYGNLVAADVRLRPLFKKLGWPDSDVRWIENSPIGR